MTFLPIVQRELRVAARRRGTYWVRSGAALALITGATWMFVVMGNETPRTVAMTLFQVVTCGAVLYALCSGAVATADSLSEEKREGTLGLLFLTDLRGYDVVLGKLVARSINVFYGLMSTVPMLAVPLLIGGVTPGEFERMAVVAVSTLFWSLAIGMFVSSICRSAQKSAGGTSFILLGMVAGLPACGAILAWLHWIPAHEPLFLLPSVGFTYYMAFDAPYKLQPEHFWYSVATLNGMACLALGLASVVAPRSWQDQSEGALGWRWRDLAGSWVYGNIAERAVFRARLLNTNAFFWLAARARLKPAYVWGFLGLMACAWLWGLTKFRRDWLDTGTYAITGIILNFLLRCWLAGEASRQLAEERKAGTLELLLSTPLTVREILRGQGLALQRQFLGPVTVTLAAEWLMMILGGPDSGTGPDRSWWYAFWIAVMIMLVADLVALYWIGMWQGLTARNPSRATSASLSLVFGVPWGIIAFIILMMALSGSELGPGRDPQSLFLLLWFFLGIVTDIAFGFRARKNLHDHFRLAAQPRYGPRSGFWRIVAGTTADQKEPAGVAAHAPLAE